MRYRSENIFTSLILAAAHQSFNLPHASTMPGETTMLLIFAVSTLFSSCCINVIFLEKLTKELPDSGSVLLFLQFLFIACEGFISNRKFGLAKRHIPLRDYAVMVSLFFISSTTNNLALQFNVPMPLHMIFKSGSLAANMLLGAYLLKRSYKIQKYISVALVTLGILICTFSTDLRGDGRNTPDYEISRISIGVMLLLISLFVSARTGIYQESLSLKYGKHSNEALFYNHALPLPMFVLLSPSILNSLKVFNASERVSVIYFSDFVSWMSNTFSSHPVILEIPVLWQYVAASVITQYFCIKSVFYLISQCTSLTVTLLLTLRKFVSLVFSVVYFQNHFTMKHWLGATFVFIGSLLYSDVFSSIAITVREFICKRHANRAASIEKEDKKRR